MFIEIRKSGKKKKYYLSHSYRVNNKVRKITRYLGLNLSEKQLATLRKRAESLLLERIKEKSLLEYELSNDEIQFFKKFDNKIDVLHLQTLDWKKFTATFTYNTNAIEGSIVSLREVKSLINKKTKPFNHDEIESLNVASAVDYIKKTKEKLSVKLIRKLHEICFKGTKTFAGEIRKVRVGVVDKNGKVIHEGAPVDELLHLLEELCQWYNKHKRKYPPLLLSAFVHDQFENIHPFQDGNGRVGRLLMNYVLLRHKYPPINIRLKDRNRYYYCLQKFQKENDIKPTMRFLIGQYKKQYR